MRSAPWSQSLLGLITRLAELHESGRALPGKVADAPADFLQSLLGTIVVIEIPIGRLIGKWKVSQNWPAMDRAGVIGGLQRDATPLAD